MNPVAAKAFWVNIYHCLLFGNYFFPSLSLLYTQHTYVSFADANIHIGNPKNGLQRKVFYAEVLIISSKYGMLTLPF